MKLYFPCGSHEGPKVCRMFPRPRKITRLLVVTLILGFSFSTYLFLVGESQSSNLESLHLTRGKMAILGRGVIYSKVYSSLGNIDKGNVQYDSMEITSGEDHADGTIFQNSVLSKFRHMGYVKEDSFVFLSPTFTSQLSVNPHNFQYIHNPSHLCTRKPVSFLVYIHSSPPNLKKRLAIRQSWGNLRLLSLFNATLVFILGATPEIPVQKLVDMEAEEYGDVVQEDFLDTYRNLTYKGMTALKWVAKHCRRVSFVLKSDDDILLDIVSLIDHLISVVIPSHGANKLVLCNLWTRMKTMRNPKSKWYLSKEEFPYDVFPPYCSGSAFLLSFDIISDMYRTAVNSPFFWVDDYFITGLLINSLKVKHIPFNQAYLLNYNVVEEKLKRDTKEYLVFHIKKLSLFQKLWPFLIRRHKGMKNFLDRYSLPYSNIVFNTYNTTQRIFTIREKEMMSSTYLSETRTTSKAFTSHHADY